MGLEELQKLYREFIEERNWEKFHKPKNIAMALTVEATELQELFQWHDTVDAEKVKQDSELMEKVREELADVMLYALSMAMYLDIDLEQAVSDKLEENREKYDIETAREFSEKMEKWRKE